jgi:hypothetical protein
MINDAALERAKHLKVALIKQDIYRDLYVAKPGDQQFYKKSPRRSGPLSLPHFFSCDFYIVTLDKAEECNLWRNKVTEAGHGSVESWLNVPHEYNFQGLSQKECSVSCDDIPYDDYDMIVSFDIAVPARIVSKCIKPLWCYFISEPPLSAYKESWKRPLCGYDVFLSQRFRSENDIYRDSENLPQPHTVDLPYVSASSSTYNSLFKSFDDRTNSFDRPKVSIPRYSWDQLTPEIRRNLSERYEIIIPSGDIENFIRSLQSSHFYLRLGNQAKFGNETIEAVASGCVFVSSPRGWKNRIFNVPPTVLDSLDVDEQAGLAIQLIDSLSKDSSTYHKIRDVQQGILNRICVFNPLMRLMEIKARKELLSI